LKKNHHGSLHVTIDSSQCSLSSLSIEALVRVREEVMIMVRVKLEEKS
jgi:hypothetical protein